jgi:hypothetical protein
MTKPYTITAQVVLFSVLITWPLVPYLMSQVFSSNVYVAVQHGMVALGLA